MLKPVRRTLLLTIAPAWATGGVARLEAWLSIAPGTAAGDWRVAGLALHGAVS